LRWLDPDLPSLHEGADHYLEVAELVAVVLGILHPLGPALADGHDPMMWDDDDVLTTVTPGREGVGVIRLN
jgi:hypothetical protein